MTSVPGYELLEVLGEGGSAEVWRARRDTGALVAVKVARSGTELSRARFAAEAAAMQAIGPPHAPGLHDSGNLDDGRPYLAMDLIEAPTVAEKRPPGSEPMAPDDVRRIGDAIATALETAHAAGVVHRDLKPANVFLHGDAATATLTDFGLALTRDRETSRSQFGVGTPKYASPEQLDGHQVVDHRADIYSLGVILYELTTGRLPFEGDADAIEYGHLVLRPPAPSQRADVPPALDECIMRCLAKRPDDRPASAADLRTALRDACAGSVASRSRAVQLAEPVSSRQVLGLAACDVRHRGLAAIEASAKRGGILVHIRGCQFLFAFLPATTEHPVDTAVDVARELSDGWDAPVAVHAAELVVHFRTGGPPLLQGRAVDTVKEWLPAESWTGVVLTEAAGQLTRHSLSPSAGAPGGFVRVGATDRRPEPALVGRGPVLASAEHSRRQCARDGTPTLWTVVGPRGSGRTRVLTEIRRQLMLHEPDAMTVFVTARSGQPLGVDLEDLRARAQRQLVALFVDDLDRASNHDLDALAYATVEEPGTRLWIAGAAHTDLATTRPDWEPSFALEPLSESDAIELTAALLHPAEYPPRATLSRLVSWAGCAPAAIVNLAAALVAGGFVRRRAEGDSHYLATPAPEQLSRSPVAGWVAARAVESITAELSALLRLCAALVPPFDEPELRALQSSVGAERAVDVGVGLAELRSRGLTTRVGDKHEIASFQIQQGVLAQLPLASRQAIHRAAAAHWRERGDDPDALERLAHHATHAMQLAEATSALLELAKHRRAHHDYLDAEAAYSRALSVAEPDTESATIALLGRGAVRYRIDRISDALTDLEAARSLASQRGNRRLELEAILERAAAFDWAERFSESEASVNEVELAVSELDDPNIAALCRAARGQSHWRMGRSAEASQTLAQAAELAAAAGCYDAQVVAATLLPLAVLRCGDVDAADEQFERSVELCESHGDHFHLAALLVNRMFLWSVRKMPDRSRRDLRRAIGLARDLGNPQVERAALYNLAEDLFWGGDDGEALRLADRARALHRRFFPDAMPIDSLLVARILAARGQDDRTRALVVDLEPLARDPDADASVRLLYEAVQLALDGSPALWDRLIEIADRELPGDEALEVRYLCALRLADGGQRAQAATRCSAAADLLADYPIWAARYRALRDRLGEN